MEIIGVTCADALSMPICFNCWLDSKHSKDGTIACPKCYGLGKVTQYFKPDPLPCAVCDSVGRIKAANLLTVRLPLTGAVVMAEGAQVILKTSNDDSCPF
jgi:hypothetical protein